MARDDGPVQPEPQQASGPGSAQARELCPTS